MIYTDGSKEVSVNGDSSSKEVFSLQGSHFIPVILNNFHLQFERKYRNHPLQNVHLSKNLRGLGEWINDSGYSVAVTNMDFFQLGTA